jgi:hypothetical protein
VYSRTCLSEYVEAGNVSFDQSVDMAALATVAPQKQGTQNGLSGLQALISREVKATTALLWSIRVGVVLLFLTPAIGTLSTVFPFVFGKAVWSRYLIEIIVGLYVILAIRAPEFRPFRNLLVLFLGLYLAALVIAGYFGSSFNLNIWSNYERMGGILDLTYWVALVAVMVFTVQRLRESKILIGLYMVVSWIPLAFALALILSFPVPGNIPDGWSGDRVSGLAGNPSFLSGQMMVNAMLALAFFADASRSYRVARARGTHALAIFATLTVFANFWILSETSIKGSMLGLLGGLVVAGGVYSIFSG